MSGCVHLYILLVLHAHEKTIFNFLSFKGASKCVSFICALLQIIIIITEKHTKTETLTASALTEESQLQTVRVDKELRKRLLYYLVYCHELVASVQYKHI